MRRGFATLPAPTGLLGDEQRAGPRLPFAAALFFGQLPQPETAALPSGLAFRQCDQVARQRLQREAPGERPAVELGALASSLKGRRRDQRLLGTFREIDADDKGFIDAADLQRFARARGLPEEYVRPFMAAVQGGCHQPAATISFERFRRFVAAQEASLRAVFDALDTAGTGQLSRQRVASGLAAACFNCPVLRCTHRCPPKAAGRPLQQQWRPGGSARQLPGELRFCEFRRLFLLLPARELLAEYWLRAAEPAICDMGGCVVVRDCPSSTKGSPWGHLLAGAAAGATSRTVTAPLETVRLQAMTGAAATSAGPFAAAAEIARRSGWRALFRGNALNVLRSAPAKAIDFYCFHAFKKALLRGRREDSSTVTTFVAAGLAGAASTVALHPLEVLRARLTCDVTGRYATGGLLGAARRIAAAEGPAALYSGLLPSVLAILPEAAITYGLFDSLKRSHARLSGRGEAGVLPSIGFGVAAATAGQMVAFPLETVARRMQVQQQATRSLGALALIRQVVRAEGPAALYRGAGPAVLRVLPMAAVSFSTYELVRLWLTQWERERRLQRLATCPQWGPRAPLAEMRLSLECC